MRRRSEYTGGWIDTTIHDFLLSIETPPSNMAFALISSLDSIDDLSLVLEKSPELAPIRSKCKLVGRSILVSTRKLLAAERRQRFFFGFDEVWFFGDSVANPKPDDISLVGPRELSDEAIETIGQWMLKTGCSLGIGDGTGMYFCARLPGIAGYLVHAINEGAANETARR